ncbi:MAG: DoxX family membrane protein [Bacteroidales bacterium]
MKSFLFSGAPLKEDSGSLALLFLRLFVGVIMLTHGWPKLMGFSEMSGGFPDPLHIGTLPSLSLAVFAEVFCSVLLIVGAFTRLAAGVLIVNMAVALFVIHGPVTDTNTLAELPLFYLVVYIYLFLSGPGKYAVDACCKGKTAAAGNCCSSEADDCCSEANDCCSETNANETSGSCCGNMGTTDRIIRMTLSMVFVALYLWGFTSGIFGIVLLIFAIPFFFAAIFGECPPYKLFGWNTKKR